MPRPSSLIGAAALAILLAGNALALVAAPEQPGPVRLIFDLYAGGIRVGEMRLDATVRDDSYAAAGKLETAGLVRAFFDAEITAQSSGSAGAGQLEPRRFESRKVDDEVETVHIDYSGGAPARMTIEPEWQPREYSIDPLVQGPVTDPLTGAFSALAPRSSGFCGRRMEMFDGRKRFAIDLAEGTPDGERIRCEGRWERVAGYKAKMMTPDRRVYPFTLWFDQRADGLWVPVRAVMPTEIVPLSLVRRDR